MGLDICSEAHPTSNRSSRQSVGGEKENTVAGAGSRKGSCGGFSAGNSWFGELWESPD